MSKVKTMPVRNAPLILILALSACIAFTGCGDPSKRLQKASQAEKSGDIPKALKIYTAVARKAAPALKFPDSKRGKITAPAAWKEEVERYLTEISESAAKPNNHLAAALEGLNRCMERTESDNSASFPPIKPLDDRAFTELLNQTFTPPPPGSTDWNAVVTFANKNKFSILRISSPKSYVYEISVVSRGASRRIDFTLYSESSLNIPLPPGDYSIIVRSSVTFQQGKYWKSDFSAFSVNIPAEPSLVAMNLRTSVTRRQQ